MSLSLLAGVWALLLPAPTPTQTRISALDRRAFLAQGGAAAAALALAPLAASADVKGANQFMPKNEKDVNKLLTKMGFAAMPVPGGFSPLVQYIGTAQPANIDGQKTRERAFSSTLLVRFLFPSGWLVESPSITENGEAGNIAAGQYLKGDACTFSALPLPEKATLETLSKDKEFFKNWLVSQMSLDVYEDVKVRKIRPVTQPDGTEMLKIDFGYTLLTRAGFTVLRKGTAAATITNNAVVGIVSATTELRYKELSPQFETMADSFRAYVVKPPAFGADSLI